MSKKPTYKELEQRVRGLEKEAAERMRVEDVLHENQELLNSILESTDDGILVGDLDGTFTYTNSRFADMWHIPKRVMETKKRHMLHELVAGQLKDPPSFFSKLEELYQSKKDYFDSVEFKDGRFFERFSTPLVRDDKITGRLWSFRDITTRRHAEEALRESEESLKLANEKLLKEHSQRKILSKRLIELLEKDRQDVAMELHDHIGQNLTALKLNLEMIDSRFKHIDTELWAFIKAAEAKAIQTLKDIKSISYGLMPGILDPLGLVPSLRELFNEVQEHRCIKINFFNKNVPKRFNQAKELAIYRIVQEALTNIVKHAKAKNVFVNLLMKGNAIFLSVEDDGIGFEQEGTMKISKGKGPLGLVIMRERAIQLDGELTIESLMGKGTHLLLEIPI